MLCSKIEIDICFPDVRMFKENIKEILKIIYDRFSEFFGLELVVGYSEFLSSVRQNELTITVVWECTTQQFEMCLIRVIAFIKDLCKHYQLISHLRINGRIAY